MVNETSIPAGYKKTEVGAIPNDWEVKKLGEIFKFLQTGNNSRSDLSEYGEIKYIHYGDIHTTWKYFLDCSKETIPLIDKTKVKNLPLLEDGDLVMADASEDYNGIGICIEVKNISDEKIVAGLHTLLLRGDKKKIADGFKTYILAMKAVHNSIEKIATGISVFGISKGNLKHILIPLPSLAEQQAIAEVLSDVDALITALDRLIVKKRNIKQGAMQQLLTGQKRLPGFTGKWETKKLGEICSPSKARLNPKLSLKNFICIELEHISQDTGRLLGYIDSSGQLSQKSFFEKGDVLFGKLRPYLKKFLITDFDGVCSTEIWVLKAERNIENRWLYYLVQMDRILDAANQSTGTKMPRAEWKIVGNVTILLPPLPEQEAIAQVLSDMDAELEALEKKREKYKAVKNGMMHQLLTGKTRLEFRK